MKYCSECGQLLDKKIPKASEPERFVCVGCGYIHYQNPNVIVSCLATWKNKALWMKRAEEPRRGYWAVPSGFMELGESLQQAAARELFEETGVGLAPEKMKLYGVGSVGDGMQVYVSFRAEMESADFKAGDESLEVALFSAQELPWDELAYPGIRKAVENFYQEMESGKFGIYLGEYGQLQKMLERHD